MANDLKPCPFCGGKPRMRDQQVAEDCVETWVECNDCDASTARIEGAYSERPAAAAYWNQRATPGVAASQAPALMEITYELRGRCFWHSNCTTQRHAPPMKFAGHPTRDGKMGSLLECTACGQRGWYQAGWIGLARVPVEPAADGVVVAPDQTFQPSDADGGRHG